MFTKEITIKGERRTVKFGTWVWSALVEAGYNINDLGDESTRNPFKFFATLIYLGLMNAARGREDAGISLDDVYDWIDEQGGVSSEEVISLVNLFSAQNTTGVQKQASKKKAAAK